MIYTPHSYQVDGRNWLLQHRSSGLFFPPGLGKTATTLDAFNILKAHKHVQRMLVVAPLRVAYSVWPSEVHEWDQFNHLDVKIIHGADKATQLAQVKDIGVINPESLAWLFSQPQWSEKFGGQMLVCDESTLFKNHGSERFKLLKSNLSKFSRRYILTGTPVPNGLVQLWPQIYILDKGLRLGNFITHYRKQYFYKERFKYELKEGAEEKIYSAIDDIVMHKSLSELDLPDISYTRIPVELPSFARELYDAMKKKMAIEVEMGLITAANAGVKTIKLGQLANGAIYDDTGKVMQIHSAKIDALSELKESLQGGQLLVAYMFNHDLSRLKAAFPNTPHIGSGTTGDELRKIIAQWNSGKLEMLFVQPRAAGHGLNLQKGNCSNVCWFGVTEDLEVYDQLNRRIYRQGVKGDVMVHHIIANNTRDEQVMQILTDKDASQNRLLEAVLK